MSIDHPGYGEQQRLESELAAAPQQQGTACGDGGVMNVREALELIAAPMRPDGTWNRDREACRQIASEALAAIDAALAEHGEIERLRGELAQRGEPVGLDAIRQCIEERDEMERKYHYLAQEMVYEGNSVAWWRGKAMAYRDAISEVWSALRAAGIAADGKKTSADGVRELATKSPQRQPLSDQVILDLADTHLYNGGRNYDVLAFGRSIERAHGIGGDDE